VTRRLFTAHVCTSPLLGLATPVAADDPLDPAGQPVESSAEDDAKVSVLADAPTGVHDKFEVGDVFVAVSGGKVQWRRVAVQGDAHILVTEHLGHKLGARANRELQCCVRVAEIMEPDLRQAGAVTDVDMLASIKFRGDQPESIERWEYIYRAIKLSKPMDESPSY